MIDLNDSLRSYFKGSDTKNFNLFDFIHSEGSPLLALMYLGLFAPNFVEFQDMVFLESDVEDQEDKGRILSALKHNKGDKTATEKSFNTIEISSLFGKYLGDTDDTQDQYLAASIAKLWKYRLKDLFPNIDFRVELLSSDQKPEDEVGVVFYQVR